MLALYRLACIDFQKKNYTRCELTLQNLLKDFPNHPLTDGLAYLIATIPVYERDWNRTIRDEGRFANRAMAWRRRRARSHRTNWRPEAQFRVIWAYMALGQLS